MLAWTRPGDLVVPDPKLNTKCVCKSQNRKCVCKSEIVIYRVFLRGADRGALTMVLISPRWINSKEMIMELGQKQKKTGIRVFWDLQTFLAWLTDACEILFKDPYFHFVILNRYSALCYQCVFLWINWFIGEKKIHRMFFSSYFYFSVALRSCGR